MAVNLYKHNKKAYDFTLEMLKTNGKAAVIHPTDTGKSSIGLNYVKISPKRL